MKLWYCVYKSLQWGTFTCFAAYFRKAEDMKSLRESNFLFIAILCNQQMLILWLF